MCTYTIHNIPLVQNLILDYLPRPDQQALQATTRSWASATSSRILAERCISGIPKEISPDGVCLHTLARSPDQDHRTRPGLRFCALSPDGTTIVSSYLNGGASAWDSSTGKLLHNLKGDTDLFVSCKFFRGGINIISETMKHEIKVQDVSTGHILHTLKGHTRLVVSCEVSPDGTKLVSGSHDNTVGVWDLSTGEILHTLEGHTDDVLFCKVSPDGTKIVSASRDGTVRVWDLSTGEILREIKIGDRDSIGSCEFSPDGTKIIVASRSRDEISVWDLSKKEPLYMQKDKSRGPLSGCAVSPDGTKVISKPDNGTLRVWDLSTGELLHRLEGHTDSVFSCAFSPDGTKIVSGSVDQTVRIWNLRTGELLHTLKGHTDSTFSCAFSADGTKVISASQDGTVRVWALGEFWWLNRLWNRLESNKGDKRDQADEWLWQTFTKVALTRIQADLTALRDDLHKDRYIELLDSQIQSLPISKEARSEFSTAVNGLCKPSAESESAPT